MAVKGKEFRYRVELDREARMTADGAAPVEADDAWTPEHLVLAGLVRCTLESLRYHAARQELGVLASGTAEGRVTRREEDGRFAFVEIHVELAIELDRAPEDLSQLLAKAERDCFVGASLTARPGYRWRVNGEEQQ